MQVKHINILTAIVQYCDQITVNSTKHHEGMDGDIIEEKQDAGLNRTRKASTKHHEGMDGDIIEEKT